MEKYELFPHEPIVDKNAEQAIPMSAAPEEKKSNLTEEELNELYAKDKDDHLYQR